MAVGPVVHIRPPVIWATVISQLTDDDLSDERMRMLFCRIVGSLIYRQTVLVSDETMGGLGAAHQLIGL